jgi:ATP-dependent RNA helicase RhlE
VYGGTDMNAQILALRKGVEILVATPGRLLDHVQNKTLMLNQVSVLILDEADRMLDMGFMPDIKRIIALLPPVRQNLLFSATFPDEIRKLTKTLLNNPAEVQIAARNATADSVTHVIHPCAREKKRELLCHLIKSRGLKQVLVFCGTRIGANRLAHQLRANHIQVDAIHGDKTQGEREAALEAFKTGKTTVLVATDVASRGLDIESLPQVINFDIPHSPEDYVHRIGRTGRAGLTGEAISLVSPEDAEALAAIEKLINKKLERVLVPGFEPNTGVVATMMGGESRGREGREGRGGRGPNRREGRPTHHAQPVSHNPQPQTKPQHSAPQGVRAQSKHSDPIFSKPYEPGTSGSVPKAQEPVVEHAGKRRERPVAALLGGLKRA